MTSALVDGEELESAQDTASDSPRELEQMPLAGAVDSAAMTAESKKSRCHDFALPEGPGGSSAAAAAGRLDDPSLCPAAAAATRDSAGVVAGVVAEVEMMSVGQCTWSQGYSRTRGAASLEEVHHGAELAESSEPRTAPCLTTRSHCDKSLRASACLFVHRLGRI